jgi:hypothetical protein
MINPPHIRTLYGPDLLTNQPPPTYDPAALTISFSTDQTITGLRFELAMASDEQRETPSRFKCTH